jgi:hypothetical protein
LFGTTWLIIIGLADCLHALVGEEEARGSARGVGQKAVQAKGQKSARSKKALDRIVFSCVLHVTARSGALESGADRGALGADRLWDIVRISKRCI